jgi:hypothetical protein
LSSDIASTLRVLEINDSDLLKPTARPDELVLVQGFFEELKRVRAK